MEANMSDPSNLNFSSNTQLPPSNQALGPWNHHCPHHPWQLHRHTRHCNAPHQMTRMYFFILHLSIADVLTAFLTLLPELIWTYTSPNFYGGGALCKILLRAHHDGHRPLPRHLQPSIQMHLDPKAIQIMIGLAWLAIIFGSSEAKYSCSASFVVDWGQKAYVTWFAVSNFFFPLLILIYCYGRICKTIWDNFNSKVPLSSDAGG
ncbi:G protein-coupled receptor Tc 45, partial [Caligus rogercresseyi]